MGKWGEDYLRRGRGKDEGRRRGSERIRGKEYICVCVCVYVCVSVCGMRGNV